MLSARPFLTRAGVSCWYWWKAASTCVWSILIMVVIDGERRVNMDDPMACSGAAASGDLGHRTVRCLGGLGLFFLGLVGGIDQRGHGLRGAVPRRLRDRLRQLLGMRG